MTAAECSGKPGNVTSTEAGAGDVAFQKIEKLRNADISISGSQKFLQTLIRFAQIK